MRWRYFFAQPPEEAVQPTGMAMPAYPPIAPAEIQAPAEQLPDPLASGGPLYGSPVQARFLDHQASNPNDARQQRRPIGEAVASSQPGAGLVQRLSLRPLAPLSAHAAQRLQAWQDSYLALLVETGKPPGATTDGFLPKATSHGWRQPAKSGRSGS